ncbi:glycerate kinase [Arthrobacter castelli]|uniref:glycerate kinase n=1 Tax=Arthrobacter castelli TaxID=271431 RepID=UPI0004101DDD|nr:glycerate kinase [Arthrobacter castelli]
MRILIAPDKFKGTLTARQAGEAMAAGVREVFPDAVADIVPVADGGEGTLEGALAAGGEERTVAVQGPLGEEVEARWVLTGKTAVIETAEASGLRYVEPRVQAALGAHSYGSGQLIKAALDAGAEEIICGIGGSAMTDGGSGALRALGMRVMNTDGARARLGGSALSTALRIDDTGLDSRLKDVHIRIAADVTNPLYGPDGAAHVFGAQKGADAAARSMLDDGLRHWAELLHQATGVDVQIPGAGAAGGFPASFLACTSATLESGFDLVAELVQFDKALEGVDLLVSGEGSMDEQSRFGKAPLSAADRAQARGIDSVLAVGRSTLSLEDVAGHGVKAMAAAVDCAPSVDEAIARAAHYLQQATAVALDSYDKG